jgi:hypothetical protein
MRSQTEFFRITGLVMTTAITNKYTIDIKNVNWCINKIFKIYAEPLENDCQ